MGSRPARTRNAGARKKRQRVEIREIPWKFDLHIAQLQPKVAEGLIEVILYLTQLTVAVMKLLVSVAKADPIGA
jgi:hypothetical protein